MTIIWTGMIVSAVLFGLLTGQGTQVAAAALSGTQSAVELCISMAGMLCLWSGVMEVLRQSGLAQRLRNLLRPILRRIYPQVANDPDIMNHIAANVSANLLGLGNAATPLGMEAARRMKPKAPGVASDEMCMLVVCNSASIQLIPTTVAAVRAAQGSTSPFDILPCVWIASAVSVTVGIAICKLCAGKGERA